MGGDVRGMGDGWMDGEREATSSKIMPVPNPVPERLSASLSALSVISSVFSRMHTKVGSSLLGVVCCDAL